VPKPKPVTVTAQEEPPKEDPQTEEPPTEGQVEGQVRLAKPQAEGQVEGQAEGELLEGDKVEENGLTQTLGQGRDMESVLEEAATTKLQVGLLLLLLSQSLSLSLYHCLIVYERTNRRTDL
jgi:hypothetical protein